MKTQVTANSLVQHVSAQKSVLKSAPKKFPLFWIKESLPCCQVQIEEQKEMLHAQQHVTVADTKEINKLENKDVKTIASRQDDSLFFLKEIHSHGVHLNHYLS